MFFIFHVNIITYKRLGSRQREKKKKNKSYVWKIQFSLNVLSLVYI